MSSSPPAVLLYTALHALRAHGFLARCRYERGCERTGFSPHAPTFSCVRSCERAGFSPHALAFCCVRLKSAKNLYLSHRIFYKIRQIHRIFDTFRQNPPILLRNQAREELGQVILNSRAAHRIYEPEMHTKSEQKYSDKARKTGKSLRHGEKIRQIAQT